MKLLSYKTLTVEQINSGCAACHAEIARGAPKAHADCQRCHDRHGRLEPEHDRCIGDDVGDPVFVVVADVRLNAIFEAFDAFEAVVIEQLRLECSEETLHGGVIGAVAFAGHALGDAACFKHPAP
jgi:hypothetical protein